MAWAFTGSNVLSLSGVAGPRYSFHLHQEDVRWLPTSSTTRTAFSSMSKRRNGYPSETHVKRGDRVVHGDKELF
jgi:hypothetical protein